MVPLKGSLYVPGQLGNLQTVHVDIGSAYYVQVGCQCMGMPTSSGKVRQGGSRCFFLYTSFELLVTSSTENLGVGVPASGTDVIFTINFNYVEAAIRLLRQAKLQAEHWRPTSLISNMLLVIQKILPDGVAMPQRISFLRSNHEKVMKYDRLLPGIIIGGVNSAGLFSSSHSLLVPSLFSYQATSSCHNVCSA